jgi:hypothetical protein
VGIRFYGFPCFPFLVISTARLGIGRSVQLEKYLPEDRFTSSILGVGYQNLQAVGGGNIYFLD